MHDAPIARFAGSVFASSNLGSVVKIPSDVGFLGVTEEPEEQGDGVHSAAPSLAQEPRPEGRTALASGARQTASHRDLPLPGAELSQNSPEPDRLPPKSQRPHKLMSLSSCQSSCQS